ncbi:hypothetical protein [Bacteriovorax sp. Seq25_V]|uniref:hypothetical protein n=1 Tax=Bacteriovorax sp. Seq25_V TaxID=1201288 RepID=UPI00038A4093|nr:hypothetical protein [Bacteriovorax sp. Seq25_V]EQC46346.1 hypothetical protein M900_1066 [Bacteriovorax sp. Seq25_V]
MKTLFLSLILSLNSYALVDYSDPSESAAPVVKRSAPVAAKAVNRSSARQSAPSRGFDRYLELSTSFASLDYANDQRAGKVDELLVKGKIETDYNIFLKFEQPFYSGKYQDDQKSVSNERGNASLILGINWFEYGSTSDAITIDLHGGAILGGSGEFTSKRTDKVVGVETSKRFYNFALSLGYELTLTGDSSDDKEQDIGNIGTMKAQLGWLVSNDISFVLTGATVTVNKSNNDSKANGLAKELKFAYVRPEVILGLGGGVDLTLAGLFRTRRVSSEDISSQLKLWNAPGLYGNSISAGLSFSI